MTSFAQKGNHKIHYCRVCCATILFVLAILMKTYFLVNTRAIRVYCIVSIAHCAIKTAIGEGSIRMRAMWSHLTQTMFFQEKNIFEKYVWIVDFAHVFAVSGVIYHDKLILFCISTIGGQTQFFLLNVCTWVDLQSAHCQLQPNPVKFAMVSPCQLKKKHDMK